MSRELISLVDALASEKNVEKDVVYDALESALAAATKKALFTQLPKTDDGANDDFDIKVVIDRETGNYLTYRRWIIVQDEDYTYPGVEKTIEQIQEEKPGTELQVGDYDEELIEGVEFCRIGAQTAKQFIMQKIRDAERRQQIDEFMQTGDRLVRGIVKRVEPKKHIVVEAGRLEAIIPWNQLIPGNQMHPGDNFKINDPIKAEVWKIEEQGTRPVMKLTRISNEFMVRLFENEVRELEEGLVKIVAVARDPGVRAKIAVSTAKDDARVEPQGTFIGPRGSRVRAVSSQLSGEKIDVILWSRNPAEFITSALAPAKIQSIWLDESQKKAQVIVHPDELAKAIGRNGQNVRLAMELTGWDLDILTAEEANLRRSEDNAKIVEYFMQNLEIDEELAIKLVDNSFQSLSEIASMEPEDFDEIEDIEPEVMEKLVDKAYNRVITEESEKQRIVEEFDPAVRELFDDDKDTLLKLHDAGVNTLDDLGDLAGDELVEIIDIPKDIADKIIMKARESWFEDEENGGAND